MSVVLKIEMPETVFSAIRKNPTEFAAEMRLAAALKWYEMGLISQEKAANVAGLTREGFKGLITSIRDTLGKLSSSGLWLSESFVNEISRKSGE